MARVLEDLESDADRGPLDPVRIFAILEKHGVEYLTIGGVAVNLHGHLRNTRDVDVLIEWSPRNLNALATALGELNATLAGVDAEHLGIDPIDPDVLYRGANFTLRTAVGGLDLFDPAEVPGARPFEEMRQRAVEAVVAGVTVRAVGFDDLIRLKRASGRDQDLEDIATLLASRRRD
jgi:hypothetical protein